MTWWPDGRSVDQRVTSTSGTTIADVFEHGVRIRGTFDVHLGDDHVRGCFDAVAP